MQFITSDITPPSIASLAGVLSSQPSNPEQTMAQAFITAVLLTQSSQVAEAVVLDAIESSDPDDSLAEAVLRRAIQASIDSDNAPSLPDAEQFDSALSLLPVGLRGVLRLSSQLRRSFVLRILMGLPAQVCARMLHLNRFQVDRSACAAAAALVAAS